MTAAQRKTPTLETLSASQIAAIRSIPPHDQAKAPERDERRPVSIFTDEAYYATEWARLFKRVPVPLILSAAVREPGTILAHNGYGVPLVIMRDKGGVARVFLNVCRHKGAKIVEACEAYKSSRITCPYHAWTYGLDGRLVGLPRKETFPTVDPETHGLVQVPSREVGGFIFAMLDHRAEPDFGLITDELVDDMAGLGIPEMHLYDRATHHLDANWKLVIEPFLEGYHVQRLHARSIGGDFADVPSAVHRLGHHIRQVSGKANFSPEMLEAPDENIHKIITHAYLVFPNTIIVTSPYYINVMIVMPRGVNRSQVDYFMLTPTPADTAKAKELFAKSFDLMQKVFGTEDFRAAALSQEGLETGALTEVVYGGLEACIPDFYKSVESYL